MPKVPNWDYNDDTNIPILSYEDIEKITLDFISKKSKESLYDEKPIPIIPLVEELVRKKRFFLSHQKINKKNDNIIRGKIIFSKKTILINEDLLIGGNEKMYRFTLAHELGHWVLHRHKQIIISRKESKHINEIIDSDKNFDFKSNTDLLQKLEFQANTFAACFLAPKQKLISLLIKVQKELGILKHLGIIYLTDGKLSYSQDYNPVLTRLSNKLMVSKTCLRYRLEKLNCIVDKKSNSNFKTPRDF